MMQKFATTGGQESATLQRPNYEDHKTTTSFYALCTLYWRLFPIMILTEETARASQGEPSLLTYTVDKHFYTRNAVQSYRTCLPTVLTVTLGYNLRQS